MNNYTSEMLDDYLVKLTDAIEPMLPSCIKLKNFTDQKEVYGFFGEILNTDLFSIRLEIPSRSNEVRPISNIVIKYMLSKKSERTILKNQMMRNEFIKHIFNHYKAQFDVDENWGFTNNTKGNINIFKKFYVKNKEKLPDPSLVACSFILLTKIDPLKELSGFKTK